VNDAGPERSDLLQLKGRSVVCREQSRSAPKHDWVDHHPHLIDDTLRHQRMDEPGASLDQDITAALGLELTHRASDIT
jgi:hypothetical protein